LKNLLYGIHPVIEAIEAGKEPDRIFIQRGISNPQISRLKTLLQKLGIVYQSVPAEKLNRLTRKAHQGVVCFMSGVDYFKVADIVPGIFEEGKAPLLLLLDGITDVRNFGAICRTAECAGVHAVIIPSRGAAMVNADAIKTSSGALSRIKICREANLKSTLTYLKHSGIQIVSCTEKAEQKIYSCDLTPPTAILMGSEEVGISEEYLRLSDHAIRIPMTGAIASLNVSVAAGIVLFEAIRQRSN